MEKGRDYTEDKHELLPEDQAHMDSINIEELLRKQNIKNLQAYWHLMRKQPLIE